jgi:urocanate hydratase
VGFSVKEAEQMMVEQPQKFEGLVHTSLVRQVAAINKLAAKGMKFWDYGNSFLLMAAKSGADIAGTGSQNRFRYPSYVEDIMGDIF